MNMVLYILLENSNIQSNILVFFVFQIQQLFRECNKPLTGLYKMFSFTKAINYCWASIFIF